MPDPADFSYTFDKLSEVIEQFLAENGFTHYGVFVQDYGGPVGFRIVTRTRRRSIGWLSKTQTPMRLASRPRAHRNGVFARLGVAEPDRILAWTR